MNLFLEYQKKIFNTLKNLEKKKLIQIPSQFNLTVELPPKNQKADISCNAAMILAKLNDNSPVQLAEILKKHLLALTDSLRGFKNHGDSITTPNQHFDSYRSNKNHYVSGFHWYVQERG